MARRYDIVVIGGGSAGSTIAKMAARDGRHVALIERDKLGGTCLNYGCDPTKALLHAASVRHAAQYHCDVQRGGHLRHAGWTDAMDRVEHLIESIRGGTHADAVERQRERGIDVYLGTGRFVSPEALTVGDNRLEGDRFVIAIGYVPAVPPIEGLADVGYITNREAVRLNPLPGRIGIIGAGPVGVEFAQIYQRFGAEVTLFEQAPHILPKDDAELANTLAKILSEEGVRVQTGVTIERVRTGDGVRQIDWRADGQPATTPVDTILVASGRHPDLDALQPQAAGLEVDDGRLAVDEYLRTSATHIWAAGDVTGTFPFTHTAAAQAPVAYHNAFGEKARAFDYSAVPWATYTEPALAHVGISIADAKQHPDRYAIQELSMGDIPRNRATGQTDGALKVVAERDSGRIVGADMLAVQADELLAPLVVAVRHGLTASQLGDTILAYPTSSQAVVFAAKHFSGD